MESPTRSHWQDWHYFARIRVKPMLWLRQMCCPHEWEMVPHRPEYRSCMQCDRVQLFRNGRWMGFTQWPCGQFFPWERIKPQVFYIPFWTKAWNRLGFAECRASFDGYPPAPWEAGHLQLEVYVTLTWPDRIRMLISGKVMLSAKLRTSVAVPMSQSVSALSVLPPNHKRG